MTADPLKQYARRNLVRALPVLFALCVITASPVHAQREVRDVCPEEGEYGSARSMVTNFLANPELADARSETGTTGIDTSQVQLLSGLSDRSVCLTLNEEYTKSKYTNYRVTYFKSGNRYFVTQILQQPEEPNRFRAGLSIIYILDEDLNYIEAYSG